MRLGSFLLGGIIGAAATVYLTQNKNAMMFSSLSMNGDSVGKIMNKAKNSMAWERNDKQPESTVSGAASAGHNPTGFAQVKDIVNEDPSLKSQVNDILAESGSRESEAVTV